MEGTTDDGHSKKTQDTGRKTGGCPERNIVPFIIEDNLKLFYYRGLKEWNNEKGYLTDTCLTAQDKYKAYLDYFRIAY